MLLIYVFLMVIVVLYLRLLLKLLQIVHDEVCILGDFLVPLAVTMQLINIKLEAGWYLILVQDVGFYIYNDC